jgi:hypothetical protein
MPETPFELHESFVDDTERQSAIIELLQLDERLQQLLAAAQQLYRHESMEIGIWDAIRSVSAAPADTPENRLRRWITLFQDDADEVHDVRSRIIHGIPASDFDIKASLWLGSYILGLIVRDNSIAGRV